MTFSDDLRKELIIALILTIVLGLLGFIYREKILKKIRIAIFKLRNKPQRVNIIHIKKYKNSPVNWLSNDIFSQIKKIDTEIFSKKGINQRCIHLQSEKVGQPISVWLEEEFDTATIENETPNILDYIVKVEMDSDWWIGYSDIRFLQQFVTSSVKIHSIIHDRCFKPQEPILQEFAICKIIQEIPFISDKKEIEDKDLKSKITLLEENKIHIITTEPTYLVETIRKYFVL